MKRKKQPRNLSGPSQGRPARLALAVGILGVCLVVLQLAASWGGR